MSRQAHRQTGTPAGPGRGFPLVKDNDYWAQVAAAVGRGAPCLLLGTSTRSLRRSLEKTRAVCGREGPR